MLVWRYGQTKSRAQQNCERKKTTAVQKLLKTMKN